MGDARRKREAKMSKSEKKFSHMVITVPHKKGDPLALKKEDAGNLAETGRRRKKDPIKAGVKAIKKVAKAAKKSAKKAKKAAKKAKKAAKKKVSKKAKKAAKKAEKAEVKKLLHKAKKNVKKAKKVQTKTQKRL